MTAAPLLDGDVLGERFVIEAQIRRGGMGAIYRAWDLDRAAPVAVKVLLELTPMDRRRFEREATLLGEVRAPNLVRYIAHAETDAGVPYLVMEWLDGETVAQRIERSGFDAATAVAMVRGAASAVGVLHAHGLVHRDLKPDNLIVAECSASDVTLIDLGLARAVGTAEPRLTATGVALGTPGYMAPEQVRGETADARADVFALGCILYEALTGYAAFAGHNHLAMRTKILLWSPPPVARLCPEAPANLIALLDTMLEKSPAKRPADGERVAHALAGLAVPAGGPKRSWNVIELPTAAHEAMTRKGLEVSHAIVLVRVAAPDASAERITELTTHLASRAVELRAAVADSSCELEILDDACIVVRGRGGELRALARVMVRAALALRALLPDARAILTCGVGSIADVVDRASVLLDHATRQSRRPAARGFIALDADSASALATDYIIDRYWLVGPRD